MTQTRRHFLWSAGIWGAGAVVNMSGPLAAEAASRPASGQERSDSLIQIRPIEGDNAVHLDWAKYPDQVIRYRTPVQIQVEKPPFALAPKDLPIRGSVVFVGVATEDRRKARWTRRPGGAWHMVLSRPDVYRIEVGLTPTADSVAVRMALTNLSPWDWWGTYVNFCCELLKAPMFFDTHGDRTIVFFAAGPRRTTETKRNLPKDPTAAGQYYLLPGRWMNVRDGFHVVEGAGVCPDPVANGLVVRLGRDDKSLIATCWRHAHHVWCGTAPARENCIHSDPLVGDLQPGETGVREGHVYLMQASLPAVAQRAAREDHIWVPSVTVSQ